MIIINNDKVLEFMEKLEKKNKVLTEKPQPLFVRKSVKDIALQTKDTYVNMAWDVFLELCKQYGFEMAYKNSFVSSQFRSHLTICHVEEEVILYHKEKGLILHTESYNNSVNSAKVYGQICSKNAQFTDDEIQILSGYIYYGSGNSREIIIDVRSNMIYKLEKLINNFSFMNPWSKMPSLYFANSMDNFNVSCKLSDINNDKISQMCEDAKIIMGYNSKTKYKK